MRSASHAVVSCDCNRNVVLNEYSVNTMQDQISSDDLTHLGLTPGCAFGVALRLARKAAKTLDRDAVLRELAIVLTDPDAYLAHPQFGELAELLKKAKEKPAFVEREAPAPYRVWGVGIEAAGGGADAAAVRLPVAVAGAPMPDRIWDMGCRLEGCWRRRMPSFRMRWGWILPAG